MESAKPEKKMSGGVVLLMVLFGLTVWVYQQFTAINEDIAESNRITESLLDTQSQLASAYAQEINLIKENLQQTQELLGQVQTENDKLHKKIALLDQVKELEVTINRLKEKNAHLINVMSSQKREAEAAGTFRSVEDGRKLLGKHRDILRQIKHRIGDLKVADRMERIAVQRERDRVKLMLGNNGFLVRDGRVAPMEIPDSGGKNIKVDVTFVK